MTKSASTSRKVIHANPLRSSVPAVRWSRLALLLLAACIWQGPAAAQSSHSQAVARDIEAVLTARDYQRAWPGRSAQAPPAEQPVERNLGAPPGNASPGAPRARLPSPSTGADHPPDGPDSPSSKTSTPLRIFLWAVIGIGLILLLVLAMRLQPKAQPDNPAARAAAEHVATSSTPTPTLSDVDEIETLARSGAFKKAVHLLLMRFIDDIRVRSGKSLEPALTSREILAQSALGEIARANFSYVVAVVEHGHFGGREIDASTYRKCLEGYRAFNQFPPDARQ